MNEIQEWTNRKLELYNAHVQHERAMKKKKK